MLVGLGALCTSPAFTQEQPAPQTELKVKEEDPLFVSPVVIDGEVLFVVRGSSALPAIERAEMVQDRILAIAEDLEGPAVKMELRFSELGRTIYADGKFITATTDADSEYEQMEVEVLATLHLQAIEDAIKKYRSARSADARAYGVVGALVWSAVFIVASFLILQLRRKLSDRIANWMARRAKFMPAATNNIVHGPAIAALIKHGLRMLFLLTFIILLYYYLSFVLLAFAESRPFAQLLITYFTDPVLSVVVGFVSYLPNLLAIAVIATFTKFVIKGFKLFFENIELGTIPVQNFEKSWIWPTFNIIRVLLILVAVVVSFPYIPGSDSAAFQGLTILVGVMVSLGSNSVIANALAGIFVIYRRSTNIGDRIRVGEHTGDVVEIKLMETYLKSIKNELVSIPNSQLLNSDSTFCTQLLKPRPYVRINTLNHARNKKNKSFEQCHFCAMELQCK